MGKNIKPSKSTSEKICGFIEQAKWQGVQTAKINHTSKYDIVDVNPRPAKIWKPNEKSTDSRLAKIVRDKSKPAPGDYNTTDAWRKTQLPNREYTAPKGKLVNFTEVYSKTKKFVPSPATYKYEMNKVYDRLSMSPQIKSKRH